MYRVADHSARIRELEEEIERLHARVAQEDAETEEAEAALADALKKLRRSKRSLQRGRIYTTATVISAIGAAAAVVFFVARSVANMPKHEHVLFNGQPAMQNECDSSESDRSNGDCRAEADAECSGKYAQLEFRETYHAAYTTQTPIIDGNGNVTGFSTQHYPARYSYVYTYRCEVK